MIDRYLKTRSIWRRFHHHSRTFSLAARLLPRKLQGPVSTLYLFCRHVDTIADKRVLEVGPEVALEELEQTQNDLHATLKGDPPNELLWRRLNKVHERYSLNTKPLLELIEGARWDLEARTIENTDDLIHYSDLVGGCVGAMMLNLLVVETSVQQDLEVEARKLGIAMQITNILRDVGEDWSMLQRIYIPNRMCRRYGISIPSMVREKQSPTERYRKMTEQLISLAESRYDESLEAIGDLPWRVRYGIRSAATMYREIMNEVRANGYDNLHERAYVSLTRKLILLTRDGYYSRKKDLLSRKISAT